MTLLSIFTHCWKTARPRPAQRHSRPRHRAMPCVGWLEDRTLLSTLLVTSAQDNGGAGTLRSVLARANNGDTIRFAPNLQGASINLTQGQLAVDTSVAIQGPGAALLAVNGDGGSRVFDVAAGTTATISGLTITGGQADSGGGIDNAGTLTLKYDVIAGNQAASNPTPGDDIAHGGGGILNEVGATLTVDHSQVVSNQASTTVGSDVFGGGLLNEGTATITGSIFQNDQAVGGGSFTEIGGSVGGGIANFSQAQLTVSGSRFIHNQATAADGAGYFGGGGAIENDAGFTQYDDTGAPGSTATITDSYFSDNGATGDGVNGVTLDNQGFNTSMTLDRVTVVGSRGMGGSLGCAGGGLLNGFATATVTDSVFANNVTSSVDGGNAQGAGILNSYLSTMTLTNVMLRGNRAIAGAGADGETTFGQAGGGGIYNGYLATLNMTGCTLTGNLARGGDNATPTADNPGTGSAFGGGLNLFYFSTATVTNCLFANNVAQGGSGAANLGGNGQGGGIENFTDCTVTVMGSTFIGNRAIGGQGSAGTSAVATGLGVGGGLDSSADSTASLTNCLFLANVALGGAGAAGMNGTDGAGGAISIGSNALMGIDDASSLTLSGSTLSLNAAVGGQGGDGANGGDGLGGGLAVFAGSSATVDTSYILFNLAQGGAAGAGGSMGQGIGGGVYNLGSFNVDAASLIAFNHASTSNNNIFSV